MDIHCIENTLFVDLYAMIIVYFMLLFCCYHSPSMQGFPFQNLLPGLLIIVVVDFNDVGHVFSSKVIITPAPPAAESTTQTE